jgi:hypothetical protein
MIEAADALEFDWAAILRDQIHELKMSRKSAEAVPSRNPSAKPPTPYPERGVNQPSAKPGNELLWDRIDLFIEI